MKLRLIFEELSLECIFSRFVDKIDQHLISKTPFQNLHLSQGLRFTFLHTLNENIITKRFNS